MRGDNNGQMHEDDHGILPGLFRNVAQEWLDEEEERRRNIIRQEEDAEDVIVAAVNKYRSEGVPENEFIFVPIPSRSK